MSLDTELTALEDDMWKANREGDGAFYARMLREDAVLVSKYGVAGRDQIVPGIQANRNPYVSTELSDRKVVRISADTGLITYKAAVSALVDDEKVDFTVLATSVYTREDGEWRSVFHQQTQV